VNGKLKTTESNPWNYLNATCLQVFSSSNSWLLPFVNLKQIIKWLFSYSIYCIISENRYCFVFSIGFIIFFFAFKGNVISYNAQWHENPLISAHSFHLNLFLFSDLVQHWDAKLLAGTTAKVWQTAGISHPCGRVTCTPLCLTPNQKHIKYVTCIYTHTQVVNHWILSTAMFSFVWIEKRRRRKRREESWKIKKHPIVLYFKTSCR